MGTEPPQIPRPTLGERVRRSVAELEALLARNDRHRDRLADVPVRISVSGTRGKSTTTRWLHDELVDREFDTYAKITGTDPLSVYNGQEWVIPRPHKTTLYENEREIERFFPMDALVVENQGITPYTTRLVHTRYLDPTVVVLTNVREDHLDTLGGSRSRIARALARAVPDGAHVICGEQDDVVREYVAEELAKRGATVAFVDIPAEYAQIPGAELVYCLDETLRHVDDTGLSSDRARTLLDGLRVDWTRLDAGRVFDAAAVNDVQSTEAIRRSLTAHDREVVQPLVYLRKDRPGRTASYIRYLNTLYDRGNVEQVRVVDGHAAAFDARTSMPVVTHSDADDPASVLDAALADGWPVVLMGNATPAFMVDLRTEIDRRASERSDASVTGSSGRPTTLADVANDGEQVLLLDDAAPDDGHAVCPALLAADEPDGVLWLSLDHSPDDLHDRWADHRATGSGPDQRFVTVAQPTRSAGTDSTDPTDLATQRGAVISISDLSQVGHALEAAMHDWPDDATVRVCVDSVTRLIDERSLMWTFRVLHALRQQLSQSGLSAHYHLSTDARDEETIATLTPLFDAVVTVNEQGEWRSTR